MAQPRTTSTRPVVTQFLARRLWSSESHSTLAESVAFQKGAFDKAVVLVRAFYALGVVWAVQSLGTWPRYAALERADPLGPGGWWFDWFSVRTSVNLIFVGYLATSLVVLLLPDRRLARAAYAFMLLQYMAFINGFDKVGADLHAWFFVSAILVLLPRRPWAGRLRLADRHSFLTVIWMLQLAVLFFYTLTGFWKVFTALEAFVDGRINGFNISGFSYIVARTQVRTQYETIFGHFLSRNELIGWFLYMGTMYLEGASVIIAFRPRLQRLWGIGLILFHVGTQLAMGFTFPKNVALLGLFLVASPFVPDRIRVKDALLDLPGVHFGARRLTYLRHRAALRRTADPPTADPPTADGHLPEAK